MWMNSTRLLASLDMYANIISGFYSPNSWSRPAKHQTPPCLTVVRWKYQSLRKYTTRHVTMDGVTGVHKYFKFMKEKASL